MHAVLLFSSAKQRDNRKKARGKKTATTKTIKTET